MDIHQIKLLIDQQHQKYSTSCYICYVCPKECYLTPPPPPPPELLQPPPPKTHLMTIVLILMLSVLASAFLFLSYLTISRYLSRRRGNTETALAGVNESHGPTLDHPIWYIRTVGLPQSTIDSISIVKYRKSPSSTGKNDCSVCLSEFRDDESLRVLPDCSHAFHVPCIDTWLRSHKNCPVCRAPILIDAASRADSGPAEGDLEAATEEAGGDGRVSDLKDGKFRGVSDLGERAVRMNLELVRRSVSMDFSLARMTGKERCSDVETEIGKRGKCSVSMQRVFSSSGCMEGVRRGEAGIQIVKADD